MTLFHDYVARLIYLTVATVLIIHGVDITLGRWSNGSVSNFELTIWTWLFFPYLVCASTVFVITWQQMSGSQLVLRRWIIYGLNPITSFMAVIGVILWGNAVHVRNPATEFFQPFASALAVASYMLTIFIPRGIKWQNIFTYSISLFTIIEVILTFMPRA